MTLNKEVHQDVRRPGRSKDAPFTGTGDTEVLSQREANGWMALAWKSNLAGCRVRPKAEAVAAIGTAALFYRRVLALVAKRSEERRVGKEGGYGRCAEHYYNKIKVRQECV